MDERVIMDLQTTVASLKSKIENGLTEDIRDIKKDMREINKNLGEVLNKLGIYEARINNLEKTTERHKNSLKVLNDNQAQIRVWVYILSAVFLGITIFLFKKVLIP